ncbi:ABC transporter substrate-binding protein [Pollutimonas thiosulfatoxidans]|uniref:SsuA/THI5-like domain-containing protein n=1 Tax=Pollutimonas thiosulfatoxidans TaxID=2028345 RepID=A0A410GEF0_9BURK|nr:ABC transporter substrate-binding protein [Pollutimonas thiosulfatoxidans]QAA94674.1 hypothetical protein CKA81_13115 [Pollutimonas thiosulfatoxidans]
MTKSRILPAHSRRTFLTGAASVLTLSALGMVPPLRAQGAPTTIRYATGGATGPNEMETLIFTDWMQKNVLQGYGRDYLVDMTYTRGTPEAGTLLAAGEADMGTLSFSVFANSIIKETVPGGIKVVADSSREGQPGYHAASFYVLEGSPIKTTEDLRGKRIGINAFGSAVDLMLRAKLAKDGIDPRKDVQIVEVTFANHAAALRAGRIDLGVIILPFWADEIPTGDFRLLFDSSDAFGTFATIFHVATNKFLAEHPAAVRAFLADYVRGLQWFYDPANREKAIALCAELTRASPEKLSYFMTNHDYYRDPNACVSAELIQRPIDGMVEHGFLAQNINVADHFDASYLPGACTA